MSSISSSSTNNSGSGRHKTDAAHAGTSRANSSTASIAKELKSESPKTSHAQSQKSSKGSAIKISRETKEFMKSHAVAASFGNIVTVLMQSPAHQKCRLPELRDLVVPAIVNNQFRIAEAHKQDSGYTIPVGVILWARVSEEIDARLSDTKSDNMKLVQKDWASGNVPWIIEAVGEQRFIAQMLRDIMQKELKGKQVKYRRRGKSGALEVAIVE